MKSTYLENRWVDQMTAAMAREHPEIPEDKIRHIVSQTYAKRYTDTNVSIHNSYENTVADTTLGEVVDWFVAERPLVSESGVFFYPKTVKRNLNVEICKEELLDPRAVIKKQELEFVRQGKPYEALIENIKSLNIKKSANSMYGITIQPSSFFYDLNVAASTTAIGRCQLSTAEICFENLLANNVKFWEFSEFHTFISHVVAECAECKYPVSAVISKVPSKDEWVSHMVDRFLNVEDAKVDVIRNIYRSLTREQRIRTYYKGNLREFLANDIPRSIMIKIAMSGIEFVDPNEVPKELKSDVESISELVTEYVNYKHSMFRYEDRARCSRRKVVVVKDTDSCLLYVGEITKFISENIVPPPTKTSENALFRRKMLIINTIACILAKAISTTLWDYLDRVHVPEEERKYVRMKNEFYYSLLVTTPAMKSYMGLMVRRENVILPKPKVDIKGLSFFKVTASEKTTAFIYKEILDNEIFNPKDGQISVMRIYRKIHKFQEQMAIDIKAGDMGYLKRGIKVKSSDAYKNPMAIGAYKAVATWNFIMPDSDRINLPATVTLVKVCLQTKRDIAALSKWPRVYRRVMDLFEHDPDYGDYLVKVTTNKDGSKDEKVVGTVDEFTASGKDMSGLIRRKGKGIKAIALPEGLDVVPEWVLGVIDVVSLVQNNMSLFTQLYKPLGLVPGKTTYNGTTLSCYTNIIRL